MTSGDDHFIAIANGGDSSPAWRLAFGYANGSYRISAALRMDDGSWKSSSWHTISDAPHWLELEWQAASAAGANDGFLK